MLRRNEVLEIQIMFRQGTSLKQIARTTGYSINTVRKYARDHKEPVYRRASRPQKLDGYRDYIQNRLKQAEPHWIPATVLFNEIKALGYTGSISLLRAYTYILKPKVVERPVIRFETEPAEQMQVDFAHFKHAGQVFYAFVAVLGFSRMLYVKFVTDQKIDTLIKCHEDAFDYFGGVPRSILYDNMKTVIIRRNAYGNGNHKLHASLYDFAKHYRFVPKVCKPYSPQTKGKVERAISYLRYSFYIPFVTSQGSVDLGVLNVAVKNWLDNTANQRVHGTTGVSPIQRWVIEKQHLLALPVNYTTNYGITNEPTTTPHNKNIIHHNQHNLQHSLSVYDSLLTSSGVA